MSQESPPQTRNAGPPQTCATPSTPPPASKNDEQELVISTPDPATLDAPEQLDDDAIAALIPQLPMLEDTTRAVRRLPNPTRKQQDFVYLTARVRIAARRREDQHRADALHYWNDDLGAAA